MKRIAILGGGISGLTAAYELELARKRGGDIDWHLYESSARLGGIVETTVSASGEGNAILEQGPDGWITEKPAARDLAIELGLAADLIQSNDATRKTYVAVDGALQAMPDRMRLMVPEDLAAIEASPLFSAEARAAYAAELASADALQRAAPQKDESVATFVRRHFGEEVLTRLAAPLLSGVFGGDVARLSVQAVMPAFVTMEREHGSLIAALQAKAAARAGRAPQPIFTSLRNGVASLTDALVAHLPAERLHTSRPALSLKREGKLVCVRLATPAADGRLGKSKKHFHHVLVATPVDATRALLDPIDARITDLLPHNASSATLVSFVWNDTELTLPPGFGFLVPPAPPPAQTPTLLACTFTDQKFPHRARPHQRIVRAFFGGSGADALVDTPDAIIAETALAQLSGFLGPLPAPAATTVRHWPRSLPQYEVGHLARIDQLDSIIAALGNLTLLGNSYRGVGLPDLIDRARTAARSLQ